MPLRSSLALLFLFSSAALAQPVSAAVVLSEVQVTGDAASDEFVELYNSGDEAVSLKDWSLRRKSQGDATAKGSSLKTFGTSDSLAAGNYFLWASSGGIFKDAADTTTSGGLSDHNSLALVDKDGNILDALTWGEGHALPFAPASSGNPEKQESFSRTITDLGWHKTKSLSPTNSKGEIWQEPVVTLPAPGEFKSIVINEVFANPKAKGDTGEFIELYNPLSEAVDLAGWEIHDASVSGKYVFPSSAKIESLGYLVITDAEFTLSLNNSDEALSLSDAAKRLVHQVRYAKTKEDVTLNLVGDKLRGGKVPTPGKENVLNADPVTKERVPKQGYRDIPVEFRASGQDSDGDALKYTWDFGDDHKSYKAKTTHAYKEKGKYTVTLTTDDGTDTTTETFEIKIEKYEPPRLRIVALAPNPKGSDTELEWIEIENREKKSVNLQGFSIATGSKRKSITNHPINDDVEIKGRSVKRLTREESKFTLNNEKGYVELRDPTGKVIHDLKYKFDASLEEGTVLRKVKGKGLIVEVSAESVESEAAPMEAAGPEAGDVPEDVLTAPEVKGVSIEAPLSLEVPIPLETIAKDQPVFDRIRAIYRVLSERLSHWL